MTKQIFIIFISFWCIMVSCNFTKSGKWAKIKTEKNLYPTDSFINFINYSLTDTQMFWVNKSYKNYPYKKYCSSKLKVLIDLNNIELRSFFEQDSFLIAKLIQSKFNQKGVSHFLGQVLANNKLSIYLYQEEGLNTIKTMMDFEIPNGWEIETDESWKSYNILWSLK